MAIFSYAQNFEDVLLWRALQHVANGAYVDIGAQDPVFDSVSKAFYEQGWRGVHVEPTAQYAELLRRDRPDEVVIHAAVADRPGMLKFYEIPDTGMSTGSKELAAGIAERGWQVVATVVPAITLDQVFDNTSNKEVHWLKIDVEGFERQVLQGWQKSLCRPWIVVIEAIHPITHAKTSKVFEKLILEKGYTLTHFDGLNCYYLSQAHRELKKHFRYGPCLWDEFQVPEISRVARSLMQCRSEAISQSVAAAEARAAQHSDEAARLSAHNAELTKALSDIAGALEHNRTALQRAQDDRSRSQIELENRQQEVRQTSDALQRAHDDLAQARDDLAQAHDDLAQAHDDLAQAGGEIGRWHDDADRARRELDQTWAELVGTRSALDRAEDGIEQTSSELTRTQGELDRLSSELQRSSEDAARHRALLHDALQDLAASFWWRIAGPFRNTAAWHAVIAAAGTGERGQPAGGSGPAQAASTAEPPDNAGGARSETRLSGRRFPVIGRLRRLPAAGVRRHTVPPSSLAGPMTGAGDDRIAASLDDFLSLHDEPFVRCAYATLLGRTPDPDGLQHYLARIRNGDSRLEILEDIRASAEGRRRRVPRDLDRQLRWYRARRLPLLGPLLRRAGLYREAPDLRRQLAIIEARLDLLARLASASVATRTAPTQIGSAAVPVLDTVILEPPAAGPVKSPEAAPWTPPLRWALTETPCAAGAASATRAEIARALTEMGHKAWLGPSGAAADVTAVVGSPPLLVDPPPGSALLIGDDWADSSFSSDWIAELNKKSSGVACASSHAAKALIDHGVTVPIGVIGLGVDHWDRVLASPDYQAPGKTFRFLHVSGCDPRDGVNNLLESFERLFTRDDDVSLIIKPFNPAPDELRSRLAELGKSNPDLPDIVLIDDTLTEPELKALYAQCQVFAAPRLTGGFGLPIAQALLSGLPVVVTGWGGHRDYCDATNSWLVDYDFLHPRTAIDPTTAICAEPMPVSLDAALLAAYQASASERFAKAWAGRKRLLEHFTWKDVALRLAALVEDLRTEYPTGASKSRIGWVTTWNVKCGIAEHVDHLLSSVPSDEYVVFAGRQEEPQTRPDEPHCVRAWDVGKNVNRLAEIYRGLRRWPVGALVVEYNYGFFNHWELNHFLENTMKRGIPVLIELHSTTDPFGDTDNWRLSDLLPALRKCSRILVHSPADMGRLKALGLVDNVMLFPLGVVNKALEPQTRHERGVRPLIASFGFCLPNKGLVPLVEAAGLLKRKGTAVRLRLLNAAHPDPASAAEAQRISEAIQRLGLQDDVEFRIEFLAEEDCLALLGEADLIVNPYQRSGESASASVRFGLTIGRPVAVTPLPIFDDLGDAVFRMPGTTSQEIAEGIAVALKHIEEDSEAARRVRDRARKWLKSHDYALQATTLLSTARAIAKTHQRSSKLAKGVFINTAVANCSIYESGRMVYNCIKESNLYSLDYFSLDMIDIPLFAAEGKIRRLDDSGVAVLDPQEYDFWVFNWHHVTMAPHLDPGSIQRLPGWRFTIVLELEPGDPLKLVPPGVFHGFVALDPAAPATEEIFAFPRPLEGDPRDPVPSSRDVPVIGSFGFGTPGKGFELLVEAVNREFERAVVRINIPRGTYTSSTDVIHNHDYGRYIAALCAKIAKPGVEVRFTEDFMSPDELLNWCTDNDLNCFMYTRRQSGLSATTDQAIMSGRPLLTSSNDTFRHIHGYIPPYPVLSLREAIKTTAPAVKRLQRDWSRAAFCRTFERMIDTFGLVSLGDAADRTGTVQEGRSARILVASPARLDPDDIYWYPMRVADCVSRSGRCEVLRGQYGDLAELAEEVAKLQPSAVIVSDFRDASLDSVASALRRVTGPRIILSDDAAGFARTDDGLHVLPRQPVIPYFTCPLAGLPAGPPGIWLIGFATPASNLEEVVAKIKGELPEAMLSLEVSDEARVEFGARVAALREKQSLTVHLTNTSGGAQWIAKFMQTHLMIFYHDPDRAEELESISSLAMTTERPVCFTRAAPFPHYREEATYVEDFAMSEIMALGMAAQIKLYQKFGEWQLYAKIARILSNEPVQ